MKYMFLFATFDLCSSFASPHENEFSHSFSGEEPPLNDEKLKLCKKNGRKRRKFNEDWKNYKFSKEEFIFCLISPRSIQRDQNTSWEYFRHVTRILE